MQTILTYRVSPRLPAALEPLRSLVYNLWWTWEPEARRIFRTMDVALWNRSRHNPCMMLQHCRQARLEELADDEHFLRDVAAVVEKFDRYMARADTYTKKRHPDLPAPLVAYFSAEYGLHESFPNYSGGLGILSGDHCKSASDLDLNFVAVGLLYRDGYFSQQINRDGWQEAVSMNLNFHELPLREARVGGAEVRVSIPLPGREVVAKVWRVEVGRISMFLLDTNLAENSPADRAITSALYGGDHDLRIRQEIVLGMGGIRALRALGLSPSVFHMNEGHSAFLSLERIREYVLRDGLDFHSALQVVAASNVFTTHTPVPAGNDAFSPELMRQYFASYPAETGLDFSSLFALGQATVEPENTFSMTILALRTSRLSNAVSQMHGLVSKQLWKNVWKNVPLDEVPITSITNGVHTKTWTAGEFHALFDRFLGPQWEDELDNPDFWLRVVDIPDEELWNLHQLLKLRTIEFLRDRLRRQRERNGESPEEIRHANRLLNPDILTVGFARRFATYKRGDLLFGDPDRLLHLVTHAERPVQFVFAGKAHPADEGGKKIIQQVYRASRDPKFQGRIVFVEDYDTAIGRRLYHGVDLWLNTPLRPLEASGTSGMKLPPNGGLNLSVPDGWWIEGYNGKNGWAIGDEISGGPEARQNEVDLPSLFNLLENRIAPLYYAKPDGRLPLAWIQLMRESMRTITPVFNTHRMVREYNERLYEKAARAFLTLSENRCTGAVALSAWKNRMRDEWDSVRILDYSAPGSPTREFFVGDHPAVEARVRLGKISPEHVRVQAYFGPVLDGKITLPSILDMHPVETGSDGSIRYSCEIPAEESGSYGLNVRVIPHHEHLHQAHELRLITWAR